MLRKFINGRQFSFEPSSGEVEVRVPTPKELFHVGTIVDTAIVIPPTTGLTYRLYYLSEQLAAAGHKQTWFIANRNHHDLESIQKLVTNSIRIHLLPLERFYNVEYMSQLLLQEGIDIMQFELSETGLKLGLPLRERTGIPLVQEVHDVEAELRASLGRDDEVDAAHFIQYVAGTIADAVVSMTPHDREALINTVGIDTHKLFLAPNGVSTGSATMALTKIPHRLVMLGNMFYPPNQEGLLYTVVEILPKVREVFPDAVMRVVGMVPDDVREQLSGPSVEFTGAIEDMEAFKAELQSAAIGLCILFSGSGMKVKILDYSLAALPIVTTPSGMSGYEMNQHLTAVAPDAAAIVEAIVALLKDSERRKQLGTANCEFVVREFGWQTIAKTMEAAYQYAHQVGDRKTEAQSRTPIPLPFWFTEKRHETVTDSKHYVIDTAVTVAEDHENSP